MTFLVIGGTGFIGSYVVNMLVDRGESVIVFDLYPNLVAFDKNVLDKIKVVRGDITDPLGLIEVARSGEIECIVHLAYLLPPLSEEKPSLALKVNCVGTNNVFEVARLIAVNRVVWASSMAVYSPAVYQWKNPVREDAPTRPATMYGACKVFNELMAHHYASVMNVDAIGLRFTVVYGSGRKRGRGRTIVFTKDLIERPVFEQKVVVQDSDSTNNWLYVKDAAKAVLLACYAENVQTRVLNIAGEAATIRTAAGYVRKVIPKAKIKLIPGEEQPGAKMLFDVSRAQREIGYEPSYSLEKGITEYIQKIRNKHGG